MAIEATLYTRLSGYTGVTAIVGTRIYPNVLPQGATVPALTYRRVSGTREHAMGSDPGVGRFTLQVDAWAATDAAAKALYTQVLLALSRYRVANEIDDIFAGEPMDLYEAEKNLHRVMTDFLVMHRETS